jgi:hypothetical protein
MVVFVLSRRIPGRGGVGGGKGGRGGECVREVRGGEGEREGDWQTFEMTTRRRRPRAMRLRRGRTVGEQGHCDARDSRSTATSVQVKSIIFRHDIWGVCA